MPAFVSIASAAYLAVIGEDQIARARPQPSAARPRPASMFVQLLARRASDLGGGSLLGRSLSQEGQALCKICHVSVVTGSIA